MSDKCKKDFEEWYYEKFPTFRPRLIENESMSLRASIEADKDKYKLGFLAAWNLKTLSVEEIMDYIEDAKSGRDTVRGSAQAIHDAVNGVKE
jgi:hypothetical protein